MVWVEVGSTPFVNQRSGFRISRRATKSPDKAAILSGRE